MKKQSVAGIIVRNFFKTMGIIALFIGLGVLSYYLTMLYYNQTARKERANQYTHVIDVNTGNESSNLIYCYNEETKKIEVMLLELFDETTKNMEYITIPANTQITISGKLYSELIAVSKTIPQVAVMSDINEYFSGDVAYEYGIKILQEDLKTDIGYFTAIPSKKFYSWFEKKSKKSKKYKPSQSLLASAAKCESGGDMENLIESMWDDIITDITLSQKQNYAEALVKANQDFIRLYRVYGKDSGDVFILKKRKNRKFINSIWEAEPYTEPQSKKTKKTDTSGNSKNQSESSNGHSIQITNGSGINGLAAAYKEMLEKDGHKVIGVGNYVGETQKKTRIIAKKKKWGKVFRKYFKNAAVEEAGTLTNGADIEIVLGTQDDLSP